MPVNMISDEDLRSALLSCRIDPLAFEVGVRTRIAAGPSGRVSDPFAGFSPLMRSAAAFLPLSVLVGCHGAPAAAKLAPATGWSKLLGYLAFPAISLFVLLGAGIFSVAKIQRLRNDNVGGLDNPESQLEEMRLWWVNHTRRVGVMFGVSLTLAFVGASWLLFLFYIISFGFLLYVLTTLAKLGLGNRSVVGRSCMMGLMFLGQTAHFSGIGNRDIHFLDQSLVTAVFFAGVLALLPWIVSSTPATEMRMSQGGQRIWGIVLALILVPLMGWIMRPILWPATSARIKHYVESFDHAPYSTVSWGQWEIPARWAVESNLNPDLTKPRQLLATEISGEQNHSILSCAARVGLLSADQIPLLKQYPLFRSVLANDPPGDLKPFPFYGFTGDDWVIRAAVLRHDLTPRERDVLEQRLHATLDENLSDTKSPSLEDVLHATFLLNVIERPVQPDQYRARVHAILRKFHTTDSGRFQSITGGFKTYLIWTEGWLKQPGSLSSTAHAIELMEIYGVPDGIDLNWVRSFLKPSSNKVISNEQWIAAVTLDRLNHLPGVEPPTWLDYLYYERTLLAAAVLVGLCLYATILSPNPRIKEEDEDAPGSEPSQLIV